MREKLAELEHDQWIAWSKDIAKSEKINPDRYQRWEKLWRPYAELTEIEKDQDREWADKALAIHEARCPYKPRIDNDNGNEYAYVMAMKEENARLHEALERAISFIDQEPNCNITRRQRCSNAIELIRAALEDK